MILKFLVFLAFLASGAAAAPAPLVLSLGAATSSTAKSGYYEPGPQELEVYSAYLESTYKLSKNDGPMARKVIVLENEAPDFWQKNRRAWENYLLRRASGPGRPSEECLRSFIARPSRYLRFFSFPAIHSNLTLVRSDQLNRLVSKSWEAFYEAYPGAQGFISFSSLTLCSQGYEALFAVRTRCGKKCEYRDLVYLQKINGIWRVVLKEALP